MTANTEIKLRPLAAGDLAAVTRLDATNGAPALHGPRAAPGRVGCL